MQVGLIPFALAGQRCKTAGTKEKAVTVSVMECGFRADQAVVGDPAGASWGLGRLQHPAWLGQRLWLAIPGRGPAPSAASGVWPAWLLQAWGWSSAARFVPPHYDLAN